MVMPFIVSFPTNSMVDLSSSLRKGLPGRVPVGNFHGWTWSLDAVTWGVDAIYDVAEDGRGGALVMWWHVAGGT